MEEGVTSGEGGIARRSYTVDVVLSIVEFDDGIHGDRLPKGSTIYSTYRMGLPDDPMPLLLAVDRGVRDACRVASEHGATIERTGKLHSDDCRN